MPAYRELVAAKEEVETAKENNLCLCAYGRKKRAHIVTCYRNVSSPCDILVSFRLRLKWERRKERKATKGTQQHGIRFGPEVEELITIPRGEDESWTGGSKGRINSIDRRLLWTPFSPDSSCGVERPTRRIFSVSPGVSIFGDNADTTCSYCFEYIMYHTARIKPIANVLRSICPRRVAKSLSRVLIENFLRIRLLQASLIKLDTNDPR